MFLAVSLSIQYSFFQNGESFFQIGIASNGFTEKAAFYLDIERWVEFE